MVGPVDNGDFKKLLYSWPEKAILHLYRYYFKRLVRTSAHRTRNLRASEEIVQDTFLYVYRNHKRMSSDPNLDIDPYLYGIVQNKTVDYYNAMIDLRQRQQEYYIEMIDDHASYDNKLTVSVETSIAIWQLISTFPPKERECLVLKFLEDLTVDEIALRLNVTNKAIERSITSAYKRFKHQGTALYKRK